MECSVEQPKVNSNGVLEIKPLKEDESFLENLFLQKDAELENNTLGLRSKIKIESPDISTQSDQLSDLNSCPVHGESEIKMGVGSEIKTEPSDISAESYQLSNVGQCPVHSESEIRIDTEKMEKSSVDRQLQPIVIEPQAMPEKITSEKHMCSDFVETCDGVLHDNKFGKVNVEVQIMVEEAQVAEEELQQQSEQKQQNSETIKDRVMPCAWPKYTDQRNSIPNMKPKPHKLEMITYSGVNVKPCVIRLKRLKLTPRLMRQLYFHRRSKILSKPQLKERKKKRTHLLYECSSSEDDNTDYTKSSTTKCSKKPKFAHLLSKYSHILVNGAPKRVEVRKTSENSRSVSKFSSTLKEGYCDNQYSIPNYSSKNRSSDCSPANQLSGAGVSVVPVTDNRTVEDHVTAPDGGSKYSNPHKKSGSPPGSDSNRTNVIHSSPESCDEDNTSNLSLTSDYEEDCEEIATETDSHVENATSIGSSDRVMHNFEDYLLD